MNRKQFRSALDDLGWNYNAAARALGISWRTCARFAADGCNDEPTARLLRALLILHATSRAAFNRVMEQL